MAFAPKTILIILALVGGLLLLLGALMAASAAGLIDIPGTDFFAMLERFFGFLEREVWLAGKSTREFFCEKELQDARDLCKITPEQLREYCDSLDEEKVGTCQTPPEGMEKFCEETWTKREDICATQNEFNSACEQVLAAAEAPSMKDMPFCK